MPRFALEQVLASIEHAQLRLDQVGNVFRYKPHIREHLFQLHTKLMSAEREARLAIIMFDKSNGEEHDEPR